MGSYATCALCRCAVGRRAASLLTRLPSPRAHHPLRRRLPIVLTWATKAKIELKQLLIPLSFAALLGGTNTIIGEPPWAGSGGGAAPAYSSAAQRTVPTAGSAAWHPVAG